MQKMNIAITILFLILSSHIYAVTSVRTLEDAPQSLITSTGKIPQISYLQNKRYISHGLNVAHKIISLQGSSYTEIVLDGTQDALFTRKEAHISLQHIIFLVNYGYFIAKVEHLSQIMFKDNTLHGTAIIGNCFEITGGELTIQNLKLQYENSAQKRISSIISFSDLGGYLHVIGTTIDDVFVEGDKHIFDYERTTEIQITNCKFTKIQIDNRDFTQQNKDREDISTGNAVYKDCKWQVCNSYNYGGALSFVSNGDLQLKDCKFINCMSAGGRGGAIYIVGSGNHTIEDCKFDSCIASYQQYAEGGSLYIDGGLNTLKNVDIKQSKVEITAPFGYDTSQYPQLGGALFIRNWLNNSQIVCIMIMGSQSGQGGAIYIDSCEGQLEISYSKFEKNIAQKNVASGLQKGSDLHFSDIGVGIQDVDLDEIKDNLIEKCSSNSNEPRVCIMNSCLYGWIDDGDDLKWWEMLIVVSFGLALIAGVAILVVFAVKKWKQKKKKIDLNLGNNNNNGNQQVDRQQAVDRHRQNIQGVVQQYSPILTPTDDFQFQEKDELIQ
ncbi:MAG: hypothetical protein EZS28_005437 [Streblomastix strix]|uniref:Right handed beta helix domain-containing protein n=1 Tax=Streblomastix strix TaxID=222440 RepID=A0A5J4WVJ7_9EUKA|nr:MAG: hypothetical protein EZS28_005437 [Streblomastix strix]